VVCGDGTADEGEACDDANGDDRDGSDWTELAQASDLPNTQVSWEPHLGQVVRSSPDGT
jgi:hypothetical protein